MVYKEDEWDKVLVKQSRRCIKRGQYLTQSWSMVYNVHLIYDILIKIIVSGDKHQPPELIDDLIKDGHVFLLYVFCRVSTFYR